VPQPDREALVFTANAGADPALVRLRRRRSSTEHVYGRAPAVSRSAWILK
jgi:hypothetical protein